MSLPRKRINADDAQELIFQFPDTDQKSIQTSLNQLGEDISHIKTSLEKKKPKITLVDLNDKLDIILQYLKQCSTG